jgi:type II secretory pathway component PulF
VWELLLAGIKTGNAEKTIEMCISALRAGTVPLSYFWERMTIPILIFLSLSSLFNFSLFIIIPKYLDMFFEFESGHIPVVLQFIYRHSIQFLIFFNGAVLAGIVLALFLSFPRLYRNNNFLVWLRERILLLIPIVRTSYKSELTAAFFSSLFILLEKGMPETEAVDYYDKICTSGWIKKKCRKIKTYMDKGLSIQDSAHETFKSDRYTRIYSKTLTAVKDKAFLASIENFALIMKNQSERNIYIMAQIIPPVVVLMYGALVGLLVVSFIYPIFSLPFGILW